MTDLIQRIETAPEPRRELFEEAFAQYVVRPYLASSATSSTIPLRIKSQRFLAMLDAQAWTSAAEMLVPEGWVIERYDLDAVARHHWVLCSADSSADFRHNYDKSLALLSAIMRAERKDDE